MDSRSPILELPAPRPKVPKPPGHLFRVVKRLSSPNNASAGVYLCLPRDLPPPFVPEIDIDEEFRASFAVEHAAFKKLPDQRLHQQTRLLEFPRLGDTLLHSINLNCGSELRREHVQRLPQLLVVKMAVEPEKIRREGEVIDFLHRGREYSTLHVGSYIQQSQFTSDPSSSWLYLRPIFGPTLAQLDE